MMNRTVVIRKNSCPWQPKIKTNTKTQQSSLAGFINPVFVVLACAAFAGVLYLYSINHTAVKGIEIQQVEKAIVAAQQENENLKIQVAQLNSLYHIEESSAQLNMSELKDATYIEQDSTVALATPASMHTK